MQVNTIIRQISLVDAKEGNKLAYPVKDKWGNLVVKENSILTNDIITKCLRRNILSIHIYIDVSEQSSLNPASNQDDRLTSKDITVNNSEKYDDFGEAVKNDLMRKYVKVNEDTFLSRLRTTFSEFIERNQFFFEEYFLNNKDD